MEKPPIEHGPGGPLHRLRGRARIFVVALLTGGLAGTALVGSPTAFAADARQHAPGVRHDRSVPVTAVKGHYQQPKPMPAWQPAKPNWPTGAADAPLAQVQARAKPQDRPLARAQAGTLPVWLSAAHQPRAAASSAAGASDPAPASVHVAVSSREAATAAGVNGVLLAVQSNDTGRGGGQAHLTLSYQQFKDSFGGDWSSRLALVALPACALSTPQLAQCRTRTPVSFSNDAKNQALEADLAVPASAAAAHAAPMVLAATTTTGSDAGGGGGAFTATSLKASGSWQAGGPGDAFSWNYQVPLPGVPGGLTPGVGLGYDSQSVDGLTSNTNNQASWVGDGWELGESFIERSYSPCHQNPAGPTQTYDSCWSDQNTLTLSLNGSTSAIVKDDATGGYKVQNGSNDRIEYLTGAGNGAQNGEYFRLTTADGTQYVFGLNQLPGWASGNATTNSVWTEPVYATAAGQPCYNATFANSWCQQAYRWNLDYVVDTHHNAEAYFYTTEQNYYAADNGTTATAPYTRGGYLSKIQYGQRDGQVYSTQPAAQVVFTVNGRCNTAATGCDVSTLSTTTATNWPDVPYDLNCANGATCSAQGPTFWTEYELTGIQTQALVGSTETPVDSWALSYSFPATGDSTKPALWLNSISRTGQDTSAGGSAGAITLPAVTFGGQPRSNRVNVTNGYPPITRQRLTTITTETGLTTTVSYSAPGCAGGTPSDASQNSTLCYPVYWTPSGQTSPMQDWFNKYTVTAVSEQDPTGGSGNDTVVTSYTPVGAPAWHYNDNPLTPAGQRTWDQFRGYSGMVVSTGTAPDPVTKTQYTYFRGLNGDTLPNSGVRSATVTDSRGDPAVNDLDQYAGRTYETQVFNGGSLVTDTIDDPWTSAATAGHALPGGLPSQQTFLTGEADHKVYTPLASKQTRATETDYTHDGYGRVIATNDQGDTSTTADDLCTTVSFADNTASWILDKVAESRTVSVNCSTTPAFPTNAVSDDLTFYDSSTTLGAAPTTGDVTLTQRASGYNGSTPVYASLGSTTVDQYGRTTAVTDPLGRTTTTAYTPATGAAPTAVGTTDPLNHSSSTSYDPLRGLATSSTDISGYVTSEQYDALGRLTAVYKPGEAAPNPPNLKYAYTISSTGPSIVDTYELDDDSGYHHSEALYDALLRSREVQSDTVDGGRMISDVVYNTDGWESEVTSPYYNSAPVATTYVQAQAGQVPSATGYSYDGDGRQTAVTAYALGTQTWQTTTSYGGDFTTVVPPAGRTATTTVTDARGRRTDLIQYLAGVPADYVNDPASDYTDTKYTYTPGGKPKTEVDPAGNTWSWGFNLLGQETDLYDPDSGHSQIGYDAAGQPVTATDARGKQITTTYDLGGRKTGSYDTTGTQSLSSANKLTGFTYDTVTTGLPSSSTSYSNGDTYTDAVLAYNTLGKPEASKITLTGENSALIPAGGLTTGFGYTLTGALQTVSEPAEGGLPAEALTYGYDKFGSPTSLTSSSDTTSWTYVSAVGYDESQRPLQYTFGPSTSQVWANMTYDPQTGGLTDIQTKASAVSGTVDDTAYTFGNATVSKGAGLLTSTVDAQNAGATVDTQCFQYDYAGRIQQAWSATDNCAGTPAAASSAMVGGPVTPYWQSWSYDPAGNRTGQTDHDITGKTANDTSTAYTYPSAGSASDQPHTLTATTATGPNSSSSNASYSYDAAGNTIGINGGALGSQTLTWNTQDKPASDTTSAGTTSFVYDADGGQLVRRDPGSVTLNTADAQLVLNTGTLAVSGTRYYTLGGVTVAERTSSGSVDYLIPDRQGTDELAVDATSQAVTRRQYLPFGQSRGAAVAWVGGDKGFVNGSNDATTGLETLGARLYDPATGRFLSRDPLLETSDPTQTNGYDYAGNDPVTGSDPTGLARIACGNAGWGDAACPTTGSPSGFFCEEGCHEAHPSHSGDGGSGGGVDITRPPKPHRTPVPSYMNLDNDSGSGRGGWHAPLKLPSDEPPTGLNYILHTNPATDSPWCANNANWVEKACSGASGATTGLGMISGTMQTIGDRDTAGTGEPAKGGWGAGKVHTAGGDINLRLVARMADDPVIRTSGNAVGYVTVGLSAASGYLSGRDNHFTRWESGIIGVADAAGDYEISQLMVGLAKEAGTPFTPVVQGALVAGAAYLAIPVQNQYHELVLGGAEMARSGWRSAWRWWHS